MPLRSPEKVAHRCEDIARVTKKPERTTEIARKVPNYLFCVPPPTHTHTFSSWLLCLLSQVTLRLDTDSFSTFQLLLTFWRTSTSLGCKSRSPPCCCPRLYLLGITFTNHSLPLGLFFFLYPKNNQLPADGQLPVRWFDSV